MSELLPCPFCGYEKIEIIQTDNTGGVIRCGGCEARMVVPAISLGGGYSKLDTSKWNFRAATPAQIQQVVEQLDREGYILCKKEPAGVIDGDGSVWASGVAGGRRFELPSGTYLYSAAPAYAMCEKEGEE